MKEGEESNQRTYMHNPYAQTTVSDVQREGVSTIKIV